MFLYVLNYNLIFQILQVKFLYFSLIGTYDIAFPVLYALLFSYIIVFFSFFQPKNTKINKPHKKAEGIFQPSATDFLLSIFLIL